MVETIVADSPRPTARTVAVVYLLYFLTAALGAFLMRGLIVPTDAVATAQNLLAHQSLYRSGFEVGLVANTVYLAVTALFYGLLAPVNRTLAMMMAFFGVVGSAIQIFAGLLQLAPLTILPDTQLATAFTVTQLQAAVMLSYKLYTQTFYISLVLFALFDILLGYLIYESTFLPRAIGALLVIAGVAWLSVLWPPLAMSIRPAVIAIGGIAEIILMGWLLLKGVDVSKWRKVTASAA
jgi:hypothetical protein